MTLLAISGVARRFPGGTTALDGVSLAVEDGDFVALLGPSGCGKSTLLRLVAGLDSPDAGTIAWPGGRPGYGPGDIGFVFQEPTLMPWATLFDNVFLPLRLGGASRTGARDRVRAAIASVGLEGFEEAWPRQLSGGMRMRASIARALVTEPRLLLMDEPFAALDEITRFRLNDDLLSIQRMRGCTVLFVTHSVFEAVYLSRRVAVMSGRPGRIAAELEVALPRLRAPAMRGQAEFAAMCGQVSDALSGASA
ncbi:MAG: ATP-binding cassette domain-containing protein [Alphaproteobacteria bacterium]|nr:ATP-binding cassette domain-containing protein [Alphaproteobacteria bacterium]